MLLIPTLASMKPPLLTMRDPSPARMLPLPLLTWLHVVLPLNSITRPPENALWPLPLSVVSPLNRVVPAPVSVPPVSVAAPVTVSEPGPPSVPPCSSSAPMLDCSAKLSVPPVMRSRPVPVNDRTATVPLRKMVLKAPSSTSSPAPGSPGLQLPARSQNESLGPTQFTWAADCPAPSASAAAMASGCSATARGRSVRRWFMACSPCPRSLGRVATLRRRDDG